jgi:hypothetical protein
MVYGIKTNIKTRFESLNDFVDTFGFLFVTSNLKKKMSKDELIKQ